MIQPESDLRQRPTHWHLMLVLEEKRLELAARDDQPLGVCPLMVIQAEVRLDGACARVGGKTRVEERSPTGRTGAEGRDRSARASEAWQPKRSSCSATRIAYVGIARARLQIDLMLLLRVALRGRVVHCPLGREPFDLIAFVCPHRMRLFVTRPKWRSERKRVCVMGRIWRHPKRRITIARTFRVRAQVA